MSIKLTAGTVGLCAITGSEIAAVFGIAAAVSTLIYNGIRIYKELKRKQ